jgi:hypothetical protein
VEFLENVDLGAVGVEEGVGIVKWVFQLLDHLFYLLQTAVLCFLCSNIYSHSKR